MLTLTLTLTLTLPLTLPLTLLLAQTLTLTWRPALFIMSKAPTETATVAG